MVATPRACPDRFALTLGLAAWALLLVTAWIARTVLDWGVGPDGSSVPSMASGSLPSDAFWSGLAMAAGLTAFGTWVVAADATITALRSARGRVCWLAVAVNFGAIAAWMISMPVQWFRTRG